MGNFTFENQGANTFLVYTIEDDQALDPLSLGMLTNNRIEGLVSVVYMQMNHVKYLKYNISSKVALQQYFQGMVGKRQFLNVFLAIASTMLLIEEYMILPGSILLDMDRIYVDVSNYRTELICLPLMNKNACVDMGKFFKNIVFSVRFDQNENCDYVTKIINYLNSADHFSLSEFKNLLQEMLEGAKSISGESPRIAAQLGTSGQSVQPKQQMPPYSGSQGQSEQQGQQEQPKSETSVQFVQPQQEPHPQYSWQSGDPKVQFQQATGSNDSQSPGMVENITENQNVKKGRFWPFGKKEKKEKQNSKKKDRQMEHSTPRQSSFGGMPIPNAGRHTAIPGTSAPVSPNPGNPAVSQKPSGQQSMGQMNIPGQNQEAPQERENVKPIGVPLPAEPKKKPIENQPANHMNFGETIVLSQGGAAGETTVLNEGMNQAALKPYLIRLKTNEKILVSKDLFKLGKEMTYADYCITDNSAVSRSHANIITREQQYYIIDTNSKNHTFVNGGMIQPNTEYRLSSGTKVRLANEEFEFKLQ